MMRRGLLSYPFSLRMRTTSWYVGFLAAALVVFSTGIYAGMQNYLKHSLQRALTGTANTVASDFLSKIPNKSDAWALGEIRESYSATPTDRYLRVSRGETVLFETEDLRDPSVRLADLRLPLESNVGATHRRQVDGQTVMVYSLPYRARDGRLFEVEAGASLFSMEQTLHSLVKILAVTSIIILICAAFGGYVLMKQPLRPLVVLTEKAAIIGRKNLGERLPMIRTGDELEHLTYSLNGMIDRLENALAHNQRFSADASHELRTPLTIMRGEIEEMLRLDDLPSQAVDNLVSTLDEIERMSRIVNSLMAITRLDAGGERMDLQVVNLSTLVQSTVEHMRPLADEKGLTMVCGCEREVLILADPMRIKQVLVNLVDNAIKYTAAKGEAGEQEEGGAIDICVTRVDDKARLQIADHGIGITSASLPFIFDRFYRADYARSRGTGGVGLGLAIVRAIVTAHEGEVSITSSANRGSTILVELPLSNEKPEKTVGASAYPWDQRLSTLPSEDRYSRKEP